jgi:hypothetical protein
MGQHKTNPTAIAAKNGELPPKKKPTGKREQERWLRAQIARKIEEETGVYSVINDVARPYGSF